MKTITECLLTLGFILLWLVVLPLAGLLAGGCAISNELRTVTFHRLGAVSNPKTSRIAV